MLSSLLALGNCQPRNQRPSELRRVRERVPPRTGARVRCWFCGPFVRAGRGWRPPQGGQRGISGGRGGERDGEPQQRVLSPSVWSGLSKFTVVPETRPEPAAVLRPGPWAISRGTCL